MTRNTQIGVGIAAGLTLITIGGLGFAFGNANASHETTVVEAAAPVTTEAPPSTTAATTTTTLDLEAEMGSALTYALGEAQGVLAGLDTFAWDSRDADPDWVDEQASSLFSTAEYLNATPRGGNAHLDRAAELWAEGFAQFGLGLSRMADAIRSDDVDSKVEALEIMARANDLMVEAGDEMTIGLG